MFDITSLKTLTGPFVEHEDIKYWYRLKVETYIYLVVLR